MARNNCSIPIHRMSTLMDTLERKMKWRILQRFQLRDSVKEMNRL